MVAFIIVHFLYLYLICCGDIESNPGPSFYTICPVYKSYIHVKKSVCSCRFVIKRKTRKGGYKMSITADATIYSNQPTIYLVSKSSDKNDCAAKFSVDTNSVLSECYVSTGHLTLIKEDCDDTIIDNGTESCDHNSTSSNSVDNNTFESTYKQWRSQTRAY